MNHLPPEINRHIFSFLNPIFSPKFYQLSHLWCFKCGEFLKNGEWIVMCTGTTGYIDYTCKRCHYDNRIYDDKPWGDLIS